MNEEDLFATFDPHLDVEISHRNLPHWEQVGRTYFITFRTVDSIPRIVLEQWYAERAAWLRERGINPVASDWKRGLQKLDIAIRQSFFDHFSEKFHDFLDECAGACVLRQSEVGNIVADSLLHFDGDRYRISDFVVMPNHVHVLVQFELETKVKKQCVSWKHYTAREINRALGTAGHFWQAESFDHLVRNRDRLEHYRTYIAENPRKAHLREGEYIHYARK